MAETLASQPPATAEALLLLMLLWPWAKTCFGGWTQKVAAEFGSHAYNNNALTEPKYNNLLTECMLNYIRSTSSCFVCYEPLIKMIRVQNLL